jgi:hypothetical protein
LECIFKGIRLLLLFGTGRARITWRFHPVLALALALVAIRNYNRQSFRGKSFL